MKPCAANIAISSEPSLSLDTLARFLVCVVVVPCAYSTTGRSPVQAAAVPVGTSTPAVALAGAPAGSRVT
jgi:hypothetical protein